MLVATWHHDAFLEIYMSVAYNGAYKNALEHPNSFFGANESIHGPKKLLPDPLAPLNHLTFN